MKPSRFLVKTVAQHASRFHHLYRPQQQTFRTTATTPTSWQEQALKCAEIVSNAKSLLVVTGAGLSAESGLPTYRGVSGLYNSVTQEEGLPIETCLSGAMYRSRPDITWKYLLQIEQACRNAKPSRAHVLIANAQAYMDTVTVMTQNVDGLHTLAGSKDVLTLHGDVHELHCTHCTKNIQVESYAEFEEKGLFPPICPSCQQPALRPHVVLFDEYLGDETCERYQEIVGLPMGMLSLMMKPMFSNHDVSLCIGTTALFEYVNQAALSGRTSIEINPEVTPLSSRVDIYIPGKATEVLEFMFQQNGWTT